MNECILPSNGTEQHWMYGPIEPTVAKKGKLVSNSSTSRSFHCYAHCTTSAFHDEVRRRCVWFTKAWATPVKPGIKISSVPESLSALCCLWYNLARINTRPELSVLLACLEAEIVPYFLMIIALRNDRHAHKGQHDHFTSKLASRRISLDWDFSKVTIR